MKTRSQCSCNCHTNPKIKHIVACCEPDAIRVPMPDSISLDVLEEAIREFELGKQAVYPLQSYSMIIVDYSKDPEEVVEIKLKTDEEEAI